MYIVINEWVTSCACFEYEEKHKKTNKQILFCFSYEWLILYDVIVYFVVISYNNDCLYK